ncbi:hypothetical protein [Absidia glauca]|uniref:Zn(2)-C6 fungal-type domain-containing protein n=1 Tax=Absidia glauca TaxID=4829 RepID=A0A168R639_ABSGL|nr:hypothetical protein [Absidia glauca]
MSNPVLSSSPTIFKQTQQKVVQPPSTNAVAGITINTTATNSNNNNNNKRVKVTLACIVCRKKKVKCDGVQPTCSRCNSMGFSCEYSDPPKKRGPPKGQVEIIESRAHRIESLRAGVAPMKHSNTQLDHKTACSVYHVPLGALDSFKTTNKKLFSLEKNTILHLISGAVDAVKKDRWSPPYHEDKPGSHHLKNDFCMKDDPMVKANYQRWTSCYFGYFNVFFPVLSQAHFMRDFSQQQADPLLCYAVCALGAKYSDDGQQDASRFLFERCQSILNASQAPATLSTVQALVILCWLSYLLANMQTCCELRRLLNQAVQDLQLHRDPGSSFGIVSIEMRRRAFWVSFVIDQWLSCCTDVRFLVLQDGCNCQWPRLEDSQLLVIDSKQWKPTTPAANNDDIIQPTIDTSCHMPDLSTEYALQITAFSEMIKLACIVGDMHDLHAPSSTTLLHHHQSIGSRLTDWLIHLPSYLDYGKPRDGSPPSPIARIYHMLYYSVQIMIHQSLLNNQSHHPQHLQHPSQHLPQHSAMTPPIASPSTASSPSSSSSSPPVSPSLSPSIYTNHSPEVNMSRAICTNAANTIIHIAEQMIQYKQHMYLQNTFMLSLTLASSVQLENSLISDQTISSLLSLDKSFQVLKNSNCSVLESTEFGQLLDRYLLDNYGIQLHDKNLDQESHRRLSCLKRVNRIEDETPRKRRHQQQKKAPSSHLNASDDKDDLLDTRLHSLLHTPPAIPSSTTPSNLSTVLDPTWLDETSSILDLFSDTMAGTSPHLWTTSPQTEAWQSPASQSPTLSSDLPTVVTPMTAMSYYSGDEGDTDYFKASSTGLFYPPNVMQLYDLISDY